MLLQAGRPLGDGAGEEDAGNRGAFPEGCLCRQTALPEGGDAELGQVAQRGDEAGRGDHVVSHHGQLSTVSGIAGADEESGTILADLLDGGVQDDDPTRERSILVGLDVTGSNADQGARVDGQLRHAGRGEHQLACPGQKAGRDLKA